MLHVLYLSLFLCSLAWQPDPLHVWNWNTVLRGESAFPLLTLTRDPWCRNLRIWCCLLCALECEQEEIVQASEESRANIQYPIVLVGLWCLCGSKFSWEQVSCCGFLSHGSSAVASSAFLSLKFALTDKFYLISSATETVHIHAPASLAMEQDKSNSCCSRGKEYVHEEMLQSGCLGGNCPSVITFCHS